MLWHQLCPRFNDIMRGMNIHLHMPYDVFPYLIFLLTIIPSHYHIWLHTWGDMYLSFSQPSFIYIFQQGNNSIYAYIYAVVAFLYATGFPPQKFSKIQSSSATSLRSTNLLWIPSLNTSAVRFLYSNHQESRQKTLHAILSTLHMQPKIIHGKTYLHLKHGFWMYGFCIEVQDPRFLNS